MPIYEYQCERCSAVTDIRHGFKETNAESCPSCGGPLKRLFNPAGIVFKGSGFYITDSRKPSGDAKASTSGGGESKPAPSKSETSGGSGDAAA